MNAVRRPNLFILGAPRCGTAAMFEFLGAHRQIHAAAIKEPYYFDPDRNERSLDEYLSLFAGATDESWLLEASPGYLSEPDVAERIRAFSPAARGIVMVRDPVEQVRSLHELRIFLHREKSLDLATELLREDVETRYWNLVRNGEHLVNLLKVFPREDVHVVVHDDFAADNAGTYRQVLEFLAVDPSFVPQFRSVNPTSAPRNGTLQRALWRDGGTLRRLARKALPAPARKAAFDKVARLNRRPAAGSQIDPKLGYELWRRLEPDVELLSSVLERDLVALWRR